MQLPCKITGLRVKPGTTGIGTNRNHLVLPQTRPLPHSYSTLRQIATRAHEIFGLNIPGICYADFQLISQPKNKSDMTPGTEDNDHTGRLLVKSTTLLLFIWLAITTASLAWNLHTIKEQTRETVLNVAQAYLDKDRAFRLWGATHGGVYVVETEKTPANPLLSHVPERDIVTPSGRELTLMNPAYMIRQMMAGFAEQSGTSGHLTSLNPINSVNQPDDWERSILLSFGEKLVDFKAEFQLYKGEKHLRAMTPFITKQPCLKCHARQGYKLGDIRGGTSISIPMQPYYALEMVSKRSSILTHFIILLCGIFGILFGSGKIRSYMRSHFSMEKNLRQQNEFISTIINSLSHPFYVVDTTTYKILLANSAAKEHDNNSATTCYALGHHRDSPCSGTEHPCPLQQVVADKKMVTVEHLHFDKHGAPLNVEVQCFPILDSNGKVTQVIEYCYDISKRKRADQEKMRLMEQLQQAQKMEAIGTLAGGIAHDFNNILTVIIGVAELVKMNLASGKGIQEKQIERVLTAGKRATDLVQQILAFSRKSEHHPQTIAPHLIVTEAVDMLRSTLPSSITIEQEIDPECGKIQADATKIHQIVVNLSTNATQSMESGKGILGVSLCRQEVSVEQIHEADVAPGPFIVLTISDTGRGMDRENIKRIFEPYFTTKKVGKGTGLGLSTVYGIVKELKGFIQVDSEPGQGTVFRAYIPALPLDFATANATGQHAALPTGTEHILLVDDEASIAQIEKETLEHLGYQVTATTNSLEALRNFQKSPDDFDLLITDMTMPDMTGVELAQKILLQKPDFPIILCSGFNEQIDEQKAKAIGIREYIKKPFIIMDIATAIKRALQAR